MITLEKKGWLWLLPGSVFLLIFPVIPSVVAVAQNSPETAADREEVYVQFLVRKAKTGAVSERALAMKKLGRIGFSTTLPVLRKGLESPDQRVRMAAIDAIGQMQHQAANVSLEKALLSEDPLLSSSAADYVTERSPEFGVPVLLSGLEHESETVRSVSVSALRTWTGFRFSFDPTANSSDRKKAVGRWRNWWDKNRMRTPEEWWLHGVRRAGDGVGRIQSLTTVVRKLMEVNSWKAIPVLINLLDHSRAPVRIQALRALRNITLHEFDTSSGSPEDVARRVRENWSDWWETHGSGGRAVWLIKKLRSLSVDGQSDSGEKQPSVRDLLVRALVRSDGNVVSRLSPLLEGTERERSDAIRVLRGRTGLSFGYVGAKGDEKRSRVVRRWRNWVDRMGGQSKKSWMVHTLTNDRRTANREAAAKHLGTIRSKTAVDALIDQGLPDPASSVREAALESLMTLTGRRLGYRAEASGESRRKMVRRWRKWWRERRDRFFEYHGF